MNVQKQFEKYIEAAKEHGELTEKLCNYRKINRAYDALMRSFKILVNDKDGKKKLKSLLNNENEYVSTWTATLLIFEFPDECEKIILEEIKKKGIWASSIRTFYEEWKDGNLEKMY